jgi:predicted O-linked N-acetylglucosamine transferase (SPINDLY family)
VRRCRTGFSCSISRPASASPSSSRREISGGGSPAPPRPDDCDPGRRIKVGYVSADFRSHSAALFFKPILLHHDKRSFEVTCYSCSNLEDDVTDRFRGAADHWRSVAQFSDEELDAQIRADRIDVLVDLSGHSAGHRLAVFARKPAPVAVSAGGTGTGVPAIDYLFSDPVVCPTEVRHLFAETIVDLPCVITIESLPDALQPSDPPALAKGYVTFGVFNRATKISEAASSLWARILHAVPRSRLLLKHYGFDHAALRGRLIEKFAPHGIAAERISFLGSSSRDEHLAAFSAVDISLDPFPHNGGISTWESLQMGVPVVALLGQTIASRAAGAILASVGMTDWVAQSAEEYLAIAVKFASAPEHLQALRQRAAGAACSFRGRQQRALHRGGRGGLSDHVGRLLPARTEAGLN